MKNFFSNKNKGLIGILGSLLMVVVLGSCVTGVDDSEILAEHNAWLVKTPRVMDLTVMDKLRQGTLYRMTDISL